MIMNQKAFDTILDFVKLVFERLRKIETDVSEVKSEVAQVKKVVDSNSDKLSELKRVVDQESLILEHEMGERA